MNTEQGWVPTSDILASKDPTGYYWAKLGPDDKEPLVLRVVEKAILPNGTALVVEEHGCEDWQFLDDYAMGCFRSAPVNHPDWAWKFKKIIAPL